MRKVLPLLLIFTVFTSCQLHRDERGVVKQIAKYIKKYDKIPEPRKWRVVKYDDKLFVAEFVNYNCLYEFYDLDLTIFWIKPINEIAVKSCDYPPFVTFRHSQLSVEDAHKLLKSGDTKEFNY